MSGSLTVPFDFAVVVSDQPGAELGGTSGGNFGAVCTYVNLREITFDVAANRPAAGVHGRGYFATDTGVLSFDNGAAWVQVAPSVAASAVGTQDVVGGIALNNAGTPLTKWDLASADAVRLRNPTTGGIRVVLAPPTVTVDIALAGPVANGRDQVAALTASTAAHFYYIGTGTGNPLGIVSPNPPTTGPVLPATYVEWAYAGPVMLTGATQLVSTTIEQDYASIAPVIVRAYALGTGAEQTFDLSGVIPPNHKGVFINLSASIGNLQGDIRVAAGGRVALTANTGANVATAVSGRVPLNSQSLFYIGNGGAAHAIVAIGYYFSR